MKNYFIGIYSGKIFIRFILTLIIAGFSFAFFLMIPLYYYFVVNQFEMFSSFLDIFYYFILKYPGFFCDCFIFSLIFSVLSTIYYIKRNNIEKRILLSGTNISIFKYTFLSVSFIFVILIFFLNDNFALKFNNKADNLIYKDWTSVYYNPAVFMGENEIIYIGSLERNAFKEFYNDIMIDKMHDNPPSIIKAKTAYLKDGFLIIKNGIKNTYKQLYIDEEKFTEIKYKIKFKIDLNLLSASIINMNISGMQKIIDNKSYVNTAFVGLFKKSKYMTLFNNLVFIFILFLLFFELNSKNIFTYYLFITIMNLIYLFIEYKFKNIFIGLSVSSNFFILLEFLLIIITGILVKVGIIFFKKNNKIFNILSQNIK